MNKDKVKRTDLFDSFDNELASINGKCLFARSKFDTGTIVYIVRNRFGIICESPDLDIAVNVYNSEVTL